MTQTLLGIVYTLTCVTCDLFISGCYADPDLFPDESGCIINCNKTQNDRCCEHRDTSQLDDELGTIDGSTIAIFIATVIGSLVTVISLLMCCFKCSKICTTCYKQTEIERRSRLRTISAGVQTCPSDAPPAYEWANPDDDLTQISIPRCPSYVKDPPKYTENFILDFVDDNIQNGIVMIEISQQELPPEILETEEPEALPSAQTQ